jgi:hypothetical protein
VIENASVDGGGENVTEHERHRPIISVRDELLPEEASLPFVDGLLDAGRSGRDTPALPGGNALYPSHVRPVELHFMHTGRFSSHLTRLKLPQSQMAGVLEDCCLRRHAPAGLAAIACRPLSDHTFPLCWDAVVRRHHDLSFHFCHAGLMTTRSLLLCRS